MSNLSPISALGRTALEAVKNLFLAVFTRALDTRFVDFSVDSARSELVITSKEESESGEVGIYRGTFRWPYTKANLDSILPYPLAIQADYPLTYRSLRAQLLTRYQILLEENEFSLTPNGTPLVDDSQVATPLMNQYGQFYLYATVSSGRFVANSKLQLVFLQPTKRVPLRGLFDLKAPDGLGALVGA